ncbi:AAA family ATPase [Lentzea aerocolonigenes]|nr:ATP-binding protein [Lentzea aerocolonigenes]
MYQDLVTAAVAVGVILGDAVEIVVDTKLAGGDDVFDDMTITRSDGSRCRRQIKHQQSPRTLDVDTFVRNQRDLRLDVLVRSVQADRSAFAAHADRTTYHIYLRDLQSDDSILLPVLRSASPDPGPLFAQSATHRFTLDADAIWQGVHRPASGKRPAGDAYEFLRIGDKDGKNAVTKEDLDWMCDRLVIETNAPAMSSDLRTPGAMEEILLGMVRHELGAGEFPNEHRSPIDVAAALIQAAYKARLSHEPLVREKLIRATGLRTNFGSVQQRTPVDESILVPRFDTVDFAVRVREVAEAGGFVVIQGDPGQGKSWLCQELLGQLAAEDWVVAEHYCYLNDADEERNDRVLSEKIFGSLLQRIASAYPASVQDQRPLLSADEKALTSALTKVVAETGNSVALVIDGIDHVTRVRGITPGQTEPSEAIAAEIASLDVPQGCAVVVLSQPGAHLRPLLDAGAITVVTPGMNRAQVGELAERLGLVSQLEPGPPDDGLDELIDLLYERSDGNPLYATYLCRELEGRVAASISAVAALGTIPAYDGSIEHYYAHISAQLDTAGQAAADVMALVDFQLTADELRAIEPSQAHRIAAALEVLRPVLRERPGRGLRIYHESFARYLRRHMDDYPEARSVRLGAIATWLTSQGFFLDARSFNSLLPTLAAAGRHREVVDRVDHDFVVHAVAGGFSAAAVNANLATAVSSAGQLGEWGVIARCLELMRAITTYQEERFGSLLSKFGDVWAAMLGLERASDRLLYEGRTVLPADDGIRMCAAIDTLGGVPPWREYLDLWHDEHDTDDHYTANIESDLELAALRGHLRTADTAVEPSSGDQSQLEQLLGFAVAWANEHNSVQSHRQLIKTLIETVGEPATTALVDQVSYEGTFCLAVAEEVNDGSISSDHGSPRDWAERACREGVPAGYTHRLVALGVALTDAPATPASLIDATHDVQGEHYRAGPVANWLDQLVLFRNLPLALAAAEAAVSGDGWYRGWLKFCIGLVRAEAAPPNERGDLAWDALAHLQDDMRPFAGSPRAVDLFSITDLILGSVGRVIELLGDTRWRAAFDLIFETCQEVNRTLDGEMGIPLPPDRLLALAMATAPADQVEYARYLLQRELQDRSHSSFYTDIAEYHLMEARYELQLRTGARYSAPGQAEAPGYSSWLSAARMLVCYGWHKDMTVFEVLDPLDAIAEHQPAEARVRLERSQPLAYRVYQHTNGRETDHAQIRWWEHLAVADPLAHAQLLGRYALEHCDVASHILERRADLWGAHRSDVPPVLAALLAETIEDASSRVGYAETVESVVARDGELDRVLAQRLLTRADEITLNWLNSSDSAPQSSVLVRVKALNVLALARGFRLIHTQDDEALPESADDASTHGGVATATPGLESILTGIPVGPAGIPHLVRAWRRFQSRPYGEDQAGLRDTLVDAIGSRLRTLVEERNGAAVVAPMVALAQIHDFRDTYQLLAGVGAYLADIATPEGNTAAAQAFALAWTQSNGRGGYMHFGGLTTIELLHRATALDSTATCGVVVDAVRSALTGPSYRASGVTQALVYAFNAGALNCGDEDPSSTALEIWDEAFAIIDARTPAVGDDGTSLTYIAPDASNLGPTEDEVSLAFALSTFVGLAQPGREAKRRTLLALRDLGAACPGLFASALPIVLRSLDNVLTLTWLLRETAELVSADPSLVAEAQFEIDELTKSPYLTGRWLARKLKLACLPDSSLEAGPSDLSRFPTPILNGAPSERLQRGEEFLWDAAKCRVSRANELVEGFHDATVESVARLTDDDGFVRSVREALRPLRSGVEDWPDAILPLHHVPEVSLQQVAGATRAVLASRGTPVTDPLKWEEDFAVTLSHTPLPLMVERTRIPRPSWGAPLRIHDEVWEQIASPATLHSSELHGTHTTDSVLIACSGEATWDPQSAGAGQPYDGWVLLGVMEDCRPGPRLGGSEQTMRTRAFEGVELDLVSHSNAHVVPPVHPRLSVHQWLDPVGWPLEDFNGVSFSLVCQGEYDDVYLDDVEGLGLPRGLMAPSPYLVELLGLRPSGDLSLVDDAGPALGLVIWRGEYSRSFHHLAYPQLEGAAVLMRPDLGRRLTEIYGGRLTSRRYISRWAKPQQ